MTNLVSSLLGEGETDTLYDYGIDSDPVGTFKCRWCGESFRFDADCASMRGHARRYGCGCIPEPVVDILPEGVNRIKTLAVRKKDEYSLTRTHEYVLKINGKNYSYDPGWNGFDWDLDYWIKKHGTEEVTF